MTVNTGGVGCGTAETETVGYDGLGRRSTVASSTTGAHTYGYADTGQTVLSEETTDPAKTARYLMGPTGAAFAVVDRNETRQSLSTDLQGSTVLAMAGGATPVCVASFDPWGDPEDPGVAGGVCRGTGVTPNGRWYRQQQRDGATGNYQAGARTYNPASATWLSPDSFKTDGGPGADLSVGTDPLTQNRYAYVNGNPINFADPSGHEACSSPNPEVCDYQYTGVASKELKEQLKASKAERKLLAGGKVLPGNWDEMG